MRECTGRLWQSILWKHKGGKGTIQGRKKCPVWFPFVVLEMKGRRDLRWQQQSK